jgi:hypothetical protein
VIFTGLVVLVAFASVLVLLPLDNRSVDKVFQSVLHRVPAAALVALVGPTLTTNP